MVELAADAATRNSVVVLPAEPQRNLESGANDENIECYHTEGKTSMPETATRVQHAPQTWPQGVRLRYLGLPYDNMKYFFAVFKLLFCCPPPITGIVSPAQDSLKMCRHTRVGRRILSHNKQLSSL